MTSAAEIITTPEEDVAAREATTSLLVKSLFALATNNPRFKRGQSDSVSIRISEGDRLEDSDEPEGSIEFSYSYDATRMRTPGERPAVVFTFSVSGQHKFISLPPHIAEDAFGLPAREAVESAGQVTLVSTLEFCLSSTERVVNVCDRRTYLDDEGDEVVEVCSCAPDEDGTVYLDLDVEDPSTDTMPLGVARQYADTELLQRLGHESPSCDDVEDAMRQWADIAKIEAALRVDKEKENTERAVWVFERIKKALLQQAGVK